MNLSATEIVSIVSLCVAGLSLCVSAVTLYYKFPKGAVIALSAKTERNRICISIDFENNSYYGNTLKTILLTVDGETIAPYKFDYSIHNIGFPVDQKNYYFEPFSCRTIDFEYHVDNTARIVGKRCILTVTASRTKRRYSFTIPQCQDTFQALPVKPYTVLRKAFRR